MKIFETYDGVADFFRFLGYLAVQRVDGRRRHAGVIVSEHRRHPEHG